MQPTAVVQSPPAPQIQQSRSNFASQTQPRSTLERLQAARLITAIKTPYLENGKFDLAAFDRLVSHQVDNGVEGLIIGGTTGEGQLMSWDEHIMLIAHTVNAYGDRALVIGNTGSNSTREALHATSQGFAVGMHAALQINPYYGKTSKTGLLQHFNATLDEGASSCLAKLMACSSGNLAACTPPSRISMCKLFGCKATLMSLLALVTCQGAVNARLSLLVCTGPAIIYNVPARTSQDIPNEIVEQLATHANFLGVKECTGNARIQVTP